MNPKNGQPVVGGAEQGRKFQFGRRQLVYGLAAVVAVVVIGVLVHVFLNHQKVTSSQKLLSKISGIQRAGKPCDYGLKQIGNKGSALLSSNQYSKEAREEGLNYLSACEYSSGHTTLAITYATKLSDLYKQDGNKNMDKYAQTIFFIKYMKNSQHSGT